MIRRYLRHLDKFAVALGKAYQSYENFRRYGLPPSRAAQVISR